jgi:K+-transporting ATPase c subunit
MMKYLSKSIQENASAPFGELADEKFVNMLEVNLGLNKPYGKL